MLTNLALKAVKPEPKPYKKSNGGGLFILVKANGSKLWRFSYRHKGKQKLLSGGRFPQMSLSEARAWREIMNRLTKPDHPWTNGQAERMVRTIKEATVKSFHYTSINELRRHVRDGLVAYNFAKQLKALRLKTLYDAIEEL